MVSFQYSTVTPSALECILRYKTETLTLKLLKGAIEYIACVRIFFSFYLILIFRFYCSYFPFSIYSFQHNGKNSWQKKCHVRTITCRSGGLIVLVIYFLVNLALFIFISCSSFSYLMNFVDNRQNTKICHRYTPAIIIT